MSVLIKRFVLGLLIVGLLADGNVANADPIGDFFRRLGNSIVHPQKHSRARSSNRKGDSKQSTTNASPTATPGGASVASPNQQSVRAASVAPPAKGAKRDVPYAIPVPGKPGTVTSPFAPNAGYIDVRSFPPGTEVKDPYTGKIFRVP